MSGSSMSSGLDYGLRIVRIIFSFTIDVLIYLLRSIFILVLYTSCS